MNIRKFSKLFIRTGFCFTVAFVIAIAPVLSPLLAFAQEEGPNVEVDTVADITTPDEEIVSKEVVSDEPQPEEANELETIEQSDEEGATEPNGTVNFGTPGEEQVGCEPLPPNPEVPCGENAVINGDFEMPLVITPQKWDIYSSGTTNLGWVVKWSDTVPYFYQGHKRPYAGKLELQAGYSDWIPQSGNQFAELDSDWDGPSGSLNGEPASIEIYQDLTTTPGETYNVSFQFSPRPGTGEGDNVLEFSWDGTVIDTISRAGGSGTDWTEHTYSFEATSTITRIQFADRGVANSLGTFIDNVMVYEICPQSCVPGFQWANNVEGENQGTKKDGSPVDAGRSDSSTVLEEADGAFYSLGQGGSIIVSFDKYILDMEGVDLSFHEITYGRESYPEETASIEVSQNGVDWYGIGTVSNHDIDGVGYLDFNSTGLNWIQYVRITDTTNFNLHSNDADGYDVDAIDATYGSCNYGTLTKTGRYNYETGLITYTIVGSLHGEGMAYDIVVTDELPTGTKFVSANYGGVENGGLVTWDMGDIGAPATGVFMLEVVVEALENIDPWADKVISFNQGLRKDGEAVLAERSDPSNALGEAERTDMVNFVSLGFGGEIILEFDEPFFNGSGPDIEIVETSYGDPSEASYPETVEVYASQYGTDWTLLGTAVLDEMVDLGPLYWAKYIKLIDISNPDNFSNGTTTDGYDVDGVRSIYPVPNICEITNTVNGVAWTENNESGGMLWATATTTTTINPLVCEQEEPEEEGSVSGMKFNDHDSNGQKDINDEGLEGWIIYAGKLVEALEVDSNGPETGTPINSSALTNGQKYFIRASSTFYAGDSITADAKYSVQEPNTIWTDIVQSYESWGPTLLDLHVDDIALDWGEYNDQHVYWQTITGTGMPLLFQIYDIYASNNEGSLDVEIYEVVAEDVTDADGNYYLDLTGTSGSLIIAEQTQTGWVQTAPSPDGFYAVDASQISTGLNFGNHFITEGEDDGGDDDGGNGGGGSGGSGGSGSGGSPVTPPDDEDDEEVAGDQDENAEETGEDPDEDVAGDKDQVINETRTGSNIVADYTGGIGGPEFEEEGDVLGDQENVCSATPTTGFFGQYVCISWWWLIILLLLIIIGSIIYRASRRR